MAETLQLASQSVFYTIQGEGFHAGEPSIFIRLAGCSVGCKQCDTDYRSHTVETVDRIVDHCLRLKAMHNGRPTMVWVTGGEPTDQNLEPLRMSLWNSGFKPALATSGVRAVKGLWAWLSVSPHSDAFAQRIGSELKLIPRLNGLDIFKMNLSGLQFPYLYCQPLAKNPTSLNDCLRFVEKYPRFKLTRQLHKEWGLP